MWSCHMSAPLLSAAASQQTGIKHTCVTPLVSRVSIGGLHCLPSKILLVCCNILYKIKLKARSRRSVIDDVPSSPETDGTDGTCVCTMTPPVWWVYYRLVQLLYSHLLSSSCCGSTASSSQPGCGLAPPFGK